MILSLGILVFNRNSPHLSYSSWLSPETIINRYSRFIRRSVHIRCDYLIVTHCSIVTFLERAIRSAKEVMFRLLLHFQTNHIDNIVKLTMAIMNHRCHRGIYNFSPFSAHTDTHVMSEISRMNSITRKHRENLSMSQYAKQSPQQRLNLGDLVRVRQKRHIFKKSPIFYPIWSTEFYKIIAIDRSQFPFTYQLDDKTNKQYYSFSLQRLSAKNNNIQSANPQNRILVQKYTKKNPTSLRSGKQRTDKHDIVYTILHKGKIEEASANDLKLFKQLYGANVLLYHPSFSDPAHSMYVI